MYNWQGLEHTTTHGTTQSEKYKTACWVGLALLKLSITLSGRNVSCHLYISYAVWLYIYTIRFWMMNDKSMEHYLLINYHKHSLISFYQIGISPCNVSRQHFTAYIYIYISFIIILLHISITLSYTFHHYNIPLHFLHYSSLFYLTLPEPQWIRSSHFREWGRSFMRDFRRAQNLKRSARKCFMWESRW